MSTFRKLYDLLFPAERKRALLLIGMILVMAMLDVIGVASIRPFMAVLANPWLVQSNAVLSTAHSFFAFESEQAFCLFWALLCAFCWLHLWFLRQSLRMHKHDSP